MTFRIDYEQRIQNSLRQSLREILHDVSKKGLNERNELNKSGKNETIYLKHIEEIIKNKKTRAEMLIEQFNKTKNLNFLVNHDENFSYSGF